jgi:glycine/D-amino acid oxidase-like deaminating enzyme
VIVEAHTVGWAASGRNGGFCEPSLTHGYENGASRWPDEMETLERLGTQNIDEIAETVKRYGMDVNFERNGSLTVAVEPHQVAALEGDVMDTFAIQAIVKSPTYLAAQSDGGDTALVHPAKLAFELARVATELGVVIYEKSPVLGLAAGPVVRTASGTVKARKVVLATNAFPSLLRRNALMTVPVYDYSLVTEPLTDAQMESIGWKGREDIADMGNQFHYYRLTPDNRILFGGYDAIYHAGGRIKESYEDRPASYEKLAGHFFTTFPQLIGLKFTHRWGGVIDSCSRYCAFFGVARGGDVAYAAGFTGLGVGASRFAAAVMLDLLAGEETERTRLQMVRDRPLPFPPEPIAMFGVNMVRWSLNRADHNDGKRNLLLKTLDKLGMGFDS